MVLIDSFDSDTSDSNWLWVLFICIIQQKTNAVNVGVQGLRVNENECHSGIIFIQGSSEEC
mgnify:CR=1 FL=1